MVRRDALLDDLSASEASVVLVRAPAGFGKSTVLQQWAYRGDRRFAWVSLDPTEGDSTLFWRYVYTAIRACIPGFASHLYDELAKPGPNLLGAIIPGLLNELATLEGPLVIVLDDYHRVQSPEVDSTIRLFARRLPRGTTLAIGTRSKPRLEVARLRSLGRVHDLGPTDLSLTLGDAASMLRTRNPDRTDEQVAWIHQASEGWPAGVYLFGLVDSLDMTLPMTSNIRDYLMTEMFSNLSRDDLRFMRESSILPYLDAASCDHITQDDSGQVRLNRLADSNQLILPLDQAGERFRFHHLLQAELRALLEREESPEAITSLHRRAMEWASDHGDVSAAIHHAVRAADLDHAITLVAEHWYDYIMSGRGQSSFAWLSEFSDHDLHTHPRLTVAAAMISAFTGHPREAQVFTAAAEKAPYEGEGLAGASTYESSIAIMRMAIGRDGPIAALADARRAAEIEPLDSPWRPALVAAVGTYTYSTVVPDTDAHSLLLEGARASTGPPEVAAYALGNLALLHAWRNDRETALSYARQAMQRIDETNVGGLLLYGLPYAVAARFSLERGGLAESRRLLTNAEQAERTASNATPFDSMVLRTTMAEACAAMEEFGMAREYAERALANLAVMTEGGLVATRLDTVIRLINRADPEWDGQAVPTGSLLSPREVQILSLLTTDDTLEGIGRRLYISRNTVKTHTTRIYRKLGVSDRQQAIAVARGLSLV